jgi:hypothetical protein
MNDNKKRRVSTAVGFLSGILACMDALREASVQWPPDALWSSLNRPHRLELGAGIALIVVTLIVSVMQRRVA